MSCATGTMAEAEPERAHMLHKAEEMQQTKAQEMQRRQTRRVELMQGQ
jgi:hypothetical protein